MLEIDDIANLNDNDLNIELLICRIHLEADLVTNNWENMEWLAALLKEKAWRLRRENI